MSVMVVIGRNFLGLAFLALVTAWVSEMRGGPVLVFPSSICLVTLRWWPCWASEPWSTPSGMPAIVSAAAPKLGAAAAERPGSTE